MGPGKQRRSRSQRKQRAAAARQEAAEQKAATPFAVFAKWMARKPQWPKVLGLVLVLVALIVVRHWVVSGYFALADKIVGGNAPLAVVLGWLPGGGAGVLIGIYLLYGPFVGYRGRLVWTVANVVWAAFGLMVMHADPGGPVHPVFFYGIDASLATVPGLLVFGPLMLVAGIVLIGFVGLFSKRAKAAMKDVGEKEKEHLLGWGVATAPLAFLAISMLTALS